MRRKWAERIVIVIAAVASIATPQKKWFVEATLPPPAAKAMIVTIQASHEPSVEVEIAGGRNRLSPLRTTDSATPTWPGQARYFVPAGARVEQIAISAGCGGGLCNGTCKPPATAYVKVASAAPAEFWIAEDRFATMKTVLDASRPSPHYRVTVETSREPIALEVEGASKNHAPQIRSGGRGPTSTFYLDWTASNSQAAPVTVTWNVRATIQGACPGATACAVPAGATVRIVSVVETRPDEP